VGAPYDVLEKSSGYAEVDSSFLEATRRFTSAHGAGPIKDLVVAKTQ
jgi:hypothetical protein